MKSVATAAVLLSLAAASVASADPHRDGHDRSSEHRFAPSREWRDHDRDHGSRHEWRGYSDRPEYRHFDRDGDRRFDRDGRHDGWNRDPRWNGYPRYRGGYYGPAPHYYHGWRLGERLPPAYYARPYVISNYYDCGLRRPPWGYHWVRVDHDAFLAGIATGVILDIVYNQFY